MNRTQAGLAFTVAWGIGAVVLLLQTAGPDLRINEVGDYVAGAVAPLAFFWFILACYQQSAEIKANTAALQTQRGELERQVQAMSDQTLALSRTADTLLEHTRPYVVAYLQAEGIMIRAVLENIGSRPAQHVKLTFDPPLEELADTRFNQDPVRQQAFLAPGQRIAVLLNTGVNVLKKTEEAELRADCIANYEDLDGREYQESFIVSHRSVRNSSAQPKSLPYAMAELNDKLKEIGGALEKIQNGMKRRG